ncbi:MAG: hypothetical protein KME13_18385 [Myxacorys californica WJT36-NPBG1]|jgi:hypothetical protein|nr:hypothetical protein [Myxacorys californica WJT36-NPBG1]
MNTTLNLKDSILAKNPNADITIISKLTDLIEKHNISWVPSSSKTGSYFIMSELSIAKGLTKDDYQKHWACEKKESTTSEEGMSSECSPSNTSDNRYQRAVVNPNLKPKPVRPSESTSSEKGNPSLPGKSFKLEGAKLKTFKRLYLECTGKDLGRINSIWVGDFEHAYSYLVQGSTEAAQGFQSLGSDAITQAALEPIEDVTRRELNGIGLSEEQIQDQLLLLCNHGYYKLEPEQSVKDFPQSKCVVRRFDLVHKRPDKHKRKVVTIYELKRNVIDLCDVITTIEAKRYVELGKLAYNTEHVKLIMVAPFGGTQEACMKAAEYGIEIMTLQVLSNELMKSALRKHPLDPYFVTETLAKKFEKILSNPALPAAKPAPILKSA